MQTILFLCTGNYYRSRYAELIFNELAGKTGLNWRAASSGLRVKEATNPRPIAKPTLAALAAAGIEPPAPAIERYPVQVTEAELAGAAQVIALKEAEHRPMLTASYPGWEDRVTYWHIHDLDQATAVEALGEIGELVRGLVQELAADSTPTTSGR